MESDVTDKTIVDCVVGNDWSI